MRAWNATASRQFASLITGLTTTAAMAALLTSCSKKETTTEPPASTAGTLSVTADQSTCGTISWSAEVFVNGASQGRRQLGPFNPITISLNAGQYSVSVQLTDGTRTYTSAPLTTQIIANQSTNRIVTCL